MNMSPDEAIEFAKALKEQFRAEGKLKRMYTVWIGKHDYRDFDTLEEAEEFVESGFNDNPSLQAIAMEEGVSIEILEE